MSSAEVQNEVSSDHKDTLQKSLSGGQWYLVNMLTQKIFVFGSFFITARLLTPADFGLVAVAGIYPSFVDALTSFTFESALTQKKEGEEKPYLNVAWSFTLLRSILIFCIVFFSAPLVAEFFHAAAHVNLFRLSGLLFIFQGFSNIGSIYFFRDLDFKKVFIRDLSLQATSSTIAVIGAFFFHSFWALFAGNTAGILAAAISTYFLNPYRPKLDLQFSKLKQLLPYTKWIFGQYLLNQSAKTLEDTLVGHFATFTNIGLLAKTKALSHALTSPVSSLISKVSFSAFARVQDSQQHIREGIYKSVDVLAGIAIPFLAVILIAGHRIISIILGDQWLGMVPMLNVLTFASTLDTIIISLGMPTFNALGKPQFTFTTNGLYLVALIVSLPFLVPTLGTYGAVISLLIASVASSIGVLILIDHLVKPSWLRLMETVGVTSISLLVPLIPSYFFLRFSFIYETLGFLVVGLFIVIGYVASVIFIGRKFKKGPYATYMLIAESLLRSSAVVRIRNNFHRVWPMKSKSGSI